MTSLFICILVSHELFFSSATEALAFIIIIGDQPVRHQQFRNLVVRLINQFLASTSIDINST